MNCARCEMQVPDTAYIKLDVRKDNNQFDGIFCSFGCLSSWIWTNVKEGGKPIKP